MVNNVRVEDWVEGGLVGTQNLSTESLRHQGSRMPKGGGGGLSGI